MYYRFLFLLTICINAFGQSSIPIGTWRTHLSYNSVQTVEIAGDRVYAGSVNSAFYIENGIFNELSKLTGLSDIGITKIRFHEKSNTVIFGYQNGNIDLIINKSTILNLNDIVRSDIQGSKKINEIHFHENLAFLSTDFGVVVLDLIRKEVKETYQNFSSTTEVLNTYATVVFSDSIYVCTNKGLYVSKFSNTNLMDFSTWKKSLPSNTLNGIPAIGASVYNDKIWVAFYNSGIFYKQNNGWIKSPAEDANRNRIFGMRTSNNQLITFGNTAKLLTEEKVSGINSSGIYSLDAVIAKNGQVYVADSLSGLMTFTNGQYGPLAFSGPSTSSFFRFKQIKSDIYALPGGYSNIYAPTGANFGLDKFANGLWEKKSISPAAMVLVDMAYSPIND
ncbi:MAG TPA: hypothetical protein VF691_00230, partial [Cytophagaceae bacterium]